MADAGNSPLVMRAACVMGRKAAMNSRDLFRFVPAVAAIVMTVPVSAQEAAAPANAAHPAAAVVRDYLNFVLQREWNKSADLVEPKSLESLQKDYMERIKRAQTMDEEEMMFRRVGTSTMEDLVALTPRDFYTAYHKGLQDRMQIDEAALERGEDETLKSRINMITNAETIFETAQRAYTLLYDEDDIAVIDRLSSAARDLDELANIDERFAPLATQLAEVQAAIDNISSELRVYTSEMEYDPQELDELNRRSTLIGTLRRKYGATVAEVLAYREKAWTELSSYENRDEQLVTLKREASALLEKITEAGTKLTAARQKAGKKLEKEVTAAIQELGMKGARFEARIESVSLSLAGFDRATFQLAANQGESMKPLKQVASGGEMSRIMLAIKTVLAGADTIPTLIFDEVDAGVGGDVARKVAQKLQSIASSHQVLCVTHLAQIAAVGDVHFTVAKASGNGRTRTDVTAIEAESREKEIARLLDGSVSSVSLEHARALLSGTR